MTDSSRSRRSTGTTPPDTDKVQTGGMGRRRKVVIGLLVIPGVLGLMLVVGVLSYLSATVPLPTDLSVGQTIVLDASGEEIGSLNTEQSRREVDVTTLPDHVRDAVLAAEDRGFYEHRGISYLGIVRAVFKNVTSGDLTGQGASTITQQYIKNAVLTFDQTLSRKLNEAVLARKLENAYSKDEILSFYLSTIYWGRGAYGLDSAARTYFGVTAAELSTSQAATLAGIIQAPEGLDPAEEPEAAERRRQFVLAGMLEQDWITQAEHDALVVEGLPQVSTEQAISSDGDAAYYIDAVKRELDPIIGAAQLYSGLTIRTAMIPLAQTAAQQAIAESVAAGEHDSGALVAIDPTTGGVIAAVGGPSFATQQLNLVQQGSNQIGSAFKPITLARYITDGFSPESVFDAPKTVTVGDTEFRNYGGSSYGAQTLRAATISSTNTVYVAVQQEVGSQDVIDTAIALGLPPQREDGTDSMQPTAGLTLGQDGFTVEQVAGVYATLAANGVRRTPHLVTEVRDRDGALIYEHTDDAVAALTPDVAAVVTNVLVDVVRSGTGKAARIDGRAVAGKTGTTNDNRDAWFGGYTPQLAAAVWVGNLDDSPVDGLTGGGSAAPVWQAFAARVLEGTEALDFPDYSLSGLQVEGAEPAECPAGYTRRAAPTEQPSPEPDGGPRPAAAFQPDVIDDGEQLPCVQDTPPTPTETPTPEPSPTPSPSPTPAPEPTPTPTPRPPLLPLPPPSESDQPTEQATPTPEPTDSASDDASEDGTEPSVVPEPAAPTQDGAAP